MMMVLTGNNHLLQKIYKSVQGIEARVTLIEKVLYTKKRIVESGRQSKEVEAVSEEDAQVQETSKSTDNTADDTTSQGDTSRDTESTTKRKK